MLYELTDEQAATIQEALRVPRPGDWHPPVPDATKRTDAALALETPLTEPTPLMVIKASGWLGGDTGWAYDLLCDALELEAE